MWLLRIALAGLTAAAIGSVAGAAEPVKIRFSWTAPVSNWGSLLLEKKELAKHLGRSYDLVPIRIGGSPPMITALATGELEIANLTYSTVALAVLNACDHQTFGAGDETGWLGS
jgi:sulfonate transport system substrate-binding protein